MRPKTMLKFSVTAVQVERETLEANTPAPKTPKALCLGEVIRSLNPTIRKLIARGYSRQQVVELLNEQGVPASLGLLKNHFRVSPGRQAKGNGSRQGASTRAASENGAGVAGGSAELHHGPQAQSRPTNSQRPGEQATSAVPAGGPAVRPAAKTT